MKQQRVLINCIIIVLFIVLISNNILAFAVSSKYYGNNPLYLQPGETADIKLVLQNQAGTQDINVKISITEGYNVIKITEMNDTLRIPKGEKIDANFKVSAPLNSKEGDIFPISIEFTTVISNEEPIGISGSIGKGFNLVIGKKNDSKESLKEQKNSIFTYLVIGIIIIAIIIYFILKNKKPYKDFKNSRKF